LSAGERVIVDGLQHVQPNATVAPIEASASPEGAAPGQPAQGATQGQ